MRTLQDHRFIPKTPSFPQVPITHFPNSLPRRISAPKTPLSAPQNPKYFCFETPKFSPFLNSPATHHLNPLQSHQWSLPFALTALLSSPPATLAAESDQVSDKINLESIVISIDDFFNRNPFFVAGVTFIWLVAIPLTQQYLKKYKPISAIDAFRKLKDDPCSQLLDIRTKQSLSFMGSPNLSTFGKAAVQIELKEGDGEGFVKEVLESIPDPGNTVICVLDNFDDNSLKAAELLFKNGFKEAYAIRGGLRGKDGWQAIQEKLLPPTVHVYPRKKKSESKTSSRTELNNQITGEPNRGNGRASAPIGNKDNGRPKSMETARERPSSPFPNYPDLKPPSSPTPSKPQS